MDVPRQEDEPPNPDAPRYRGPNEHALPESQPKRGGTERGSLVLDRPPPYLLTEDLAALGSQAGESLAAATTLRAAFAGRRIALGELVVDLPWDELKRPIDASVLHDALGTTAEKAGYRFVPESVGFPCSAVLVGRLTACVRRSGGGLVAADYALGLAIVEPSGKIPWAALLEKTENGSKGPLRAHALKGSDLDALADEAVAAVASELRARGVTRVHVVPDTGPDPLGLASDQLALKAALADRVLVRVVARGFEVFGRELDAGSDAARVFVSAGGVHDDPVIDTETYRFGIDLGGSSDGPPWKRWERIVARSGGR